MSEKRDKLMSVLKDLNKGFKGRNPIKLASDLEEKEKAPTPNETLNNFLGGGFVYGNFQLVYGSEGAGKSTLASQTIAIQQKKGKVCMLIDLEHKFDAKWAEYMGVDLKNLILVDDVQYAEESMEIVKTVCEEGVVDFIVIDSLHGMSVKGEQETSKGVKKEFTDETMAILARKLSEFFRKTANAVAKAKVCVLIVAQARMDLGGFIAKMGTSGGKAKDHWMVLGFSMRRGANADVPTIKKEFINPETGRKNTEKVVVGHDVVIKIIKDHVFGCSKTGSELHIPFYHEFGFNEIDESFYQIKEEK